MNTPYIRVTEEFSRALARVLFFRETKQYGNAMEELDNISKKMSGFDLEQIITLGIEGVKDFFDFNNQDAIEKVFYTGKALKEEAMIFFETGKIDEGMECIALALGIFELIEGNNIPGLANEILLIRSRIN